MKIKIVKEVDKDAWQKLLMQSNYSSVFHTLEWLTVLEKTYPLYRKRFIIAFENNEIFGGIPLIFTRSNYLFWKIFSLPFGTYGGIVLKNDVSESIKEKLFKKLLNLFRQINVSKVTITDFFNQCQDLENFGFKKREMFTLITVTNKEIKKIWQDELSSDTRTKIKQGERYGLKVEEVNSLSEIKECFEIFYATDKRHGYIKPVYPLELFTNIYQTMKIYFKWFKAVYQNKTIATLLSFTFKNSVMAWIAGSYSEYLYLRPNNVLFWSLIEFGHKAGYQYVDFSAISPYQKGLLHFKEGFASKRKYYYVYWKKKF